MLLEAQGLIKLKDGAGINAAKLDIVENPKNLDIVELEAAQLPRSLRMWTWRSSTAIIPSGRSEHCQGLHRP